MLRVEKRKKTQTVLKMWKKWKGLYFVANMEKQYYEIVSKGGVVLCRREILKKWNFFWKPICTD